MDRIVNYKIGNTGKLNTIELLRFPLAILVIWIHSQFGNDILISHPLLMTESMVFGKLLGRLAVPTFFFISGYLFFYGKEWNMAVYREKIKKRFRTLFIPYIIWNGLAILFLFLIQRLHLVSADKMVADYGLTDYLYSFWASGLINGASLWEINYTANVSMWFIRDLICMVLLTPFLYYLLTKRRILPITLIGLLWVLDIPSLPGLMWVSLFWFMFGSWLSINKFDLEDFIKKAIGCVFYYILPLYLISCAIAIHAYLSNLGYMLIAFNFTILFGCPLLLYIAKFISDKGFSISSSFLKSTFMVYASHIFIVTIMMGGTKRYTNSDMMLSVIYLLAPAICCLIIVPINLFIDKWCPRLNSVICGGRTA